MKKDAALCATCPLGNRGRHVPPFGPAKATIAFLGEAPGNTEVRVGRPFVGESGKLLRAAISACGRVPSEFYYTNACKCQLSKDKAIDDKALAICSTTLKEEFQSRGVEIIVAMGNSAMQGLGLSTQGITKMQGRPLKWHDFTVFPILHPASILHHPDNWVDFADNLEEVLREGGPRLELAPAFSNYAVLSTEGAVRFLTWLRQQTFVYFDIETSNLNILDTTILSIAFTCGSDYVVVLPKAVLDHADVRAALRRACANPSLKWCGHNAQFDVARLITQYRAHPYISEDTILEHFVLDERLGTHGLKQLAMKLLRVPDWEADIKKWISKEHSSYALIPEENLWSYNAKDVAYGYDLHQLLRPQVASEEDLERVYTELLIPGTNALVDMSVRGVKIDIDRLKTTQTEAEQTIDRLRTEMRTLVDLPEFNPNSPKQVGHILYDIYKAPPFSRSKSLPIELIEPVAVPYGRNDKTTAKDQMARLAQPIYPCAPFASLMLKYKKAHQLVSTYLKNLHPESDGRIHPGLKLFGTVTGRLSGSKPNVLNLTRIGPVRGLVVPEPGNILLTIDYKASELRVLAALAGSKGLLELFRTGDDPHNFVGESIYGDNYDVEKHRVGVKGINFGVAFGLGIPGIAAMLGVSFSEAKRIHSLVLRLLGVDEWMQQQFRDVKTRQYVTTPTGRRRRFPLILSTLWSKIKKQAINMPVQSTSHDLCLLSLIETNKWLKDFGGTILFPTHDSLLLEFPIKHVDAVASLVTKEMLDAGTTILGEDFTAAVDIAVGYSYDKKDMGKYIIGGGAK